MPSDPLNLLNLPRKPFSVFCRERGYTPAFPRSNAPIRWPSPVACLLVRFLAVFPVFVPIISIAGTPAASGGGSSFIFQRLPVAVTPIII